MSVKNNTNTIQFMYTANNFDNVNRPQTRVAPIVFAKQC